MEIIKFLHQFNVKTGTNNLIENNNENNSEKNANEKINNEKTQTKILKIRVFVVKSLKIIK